jgi:putative cardiolipin synthase
MAALRNEQSERDDLTPAAARVVAVYPLAEAARQATRNSLAELLPHGLAKPARELILISGYFVPTATGCDELANLRREGTRVRVLTNPFAATDVGLVHAGYAPCRRRLLEHGIELFEMPAPDDAPKTGGKFVRAGSARTRRHSGKSLHAKVYIVDRRQLYIGSANFDPRSAHINTELGFFIESAVLAERLAEDFEAAVQNSYRLDLSPKNALRWTDARDDHPVAEGTEPGTTIVSRLIIRLLSKLSIEDQL